MKNFQNSDQDIQEFLTDLRVLLKAALKSQKTQTKALFKGLDVDDRIKMLNAVEDVRQRRSKQVMENLNVLLEPFKPAIANLAIAAEKATAELVEEVS